MGNSCSDEEEATAICDRAASWILYIRTGPWYVYGRTGSLGMEGRQYR